MGNSVDSGEQTTNPFEGQKPGTSGLRRKTKVFMQPNYLENFIQSTLNAVVKTNIQISGGTLVIGGDGRFFTVEAIKTITAVAAANGVSKVLIGVDGMLSTPAASAVLRERAKHDPSLFGGFILTASHNPGGIDEDFGVKYNTSDGAPASDTLTGMIFHETKIITQFRRVSIPDFDMSKVQTFEYLEGSFKIEIVDGVQEWINLMKGIFDFGTLGELFKRSDFSMIFDGMNGVGGPYARRLLIDELGAKPGSLIRCTPLPDFGGGHPDPNLVYAEELVKIMKAIVPEKATHTTPRFGAAADGDCDRNMILGRGFFVTPSDSVAIIAEYAQKCIPFFKDGLLGVSRSMPTSSALDTVAKELGIECYVVPTGWKYFGNLLNGGRISICGEESFGSGSSHMREKDGLWAVLCWLSILAYHNKDNKLPFVGVEEIVSNFWKKYGRFYYARYDFENVESAQAQAVIDHLRLLIDTPQVEADRVNESLDETYRVDIAEACEFHYTDPTDGQVSRNQGIIIRMKDSSRIVYRLSGTGSQGATIRIYLERFDKERLDMDTQKILKPLGRAALALGKITEKCARSEPTVIT